MLSHNMSTGDFSRTQVSTESAQVSPASAGSAWFVCLLGSEPSESQLRLTQDTVSPDCRA